MTIEAVSSRSRKPAPGLVSQAAAELPSRQSLRALRILFAAALSAAAAVMMLWAAQVALQAVLELVADVAFGIWRLSGH